MRPADGAAVADLGVADVGRGVGQDRRVALEHVADLDVAVAGERADGDVVALVPDVVELVEPADVDEHRRGGEAQLHEREERVAAGEDLGLVAVLGEQRQGLVGRAGPDVVERGGDHCCTATFVPPLPVLAAASTDWTMLW